MDSLDYSSEGCFQRQFHKGHQIVFILSLSKVRAAKVDSILKEIMSILYIVAKGFKPNIMVSKKVKRKFVLVGDTARANPT